jgi:hypothetical protein
MKKVIILAAIMSLAAATISCGGSAGTQERRTTLVKKYFKNDDTFIIVAKGYPRETVDNQIQALETAKEAALLNAQIIAKESFDDTVDVVKKGSVDSYEVFDDYATVTYSVTMNGLNKRQRVIIPGVTDQR